MIVFPSILTLSQCWALLDVKGTHNRGDPENKFATVMTLLLLLIIQKMTGTLEKDKLFERDNDSWKNTDSLGKEMVFWLCFGREWG